jgi:hypothetical protein
MTTAPLITIDIVPGLSGEPPMIRASTHSSVVDSHDSTRNAITGNTDTAMVARAMLSSAAYLFAQGQPVKFGPEVPVEALK